MATTTERKVTVKRDGKIIAQVMLDRWVGGPYRSNERWKAHAFHPHNMEGYQHEGLRTGSRDAAERSWRQRVIAFAADGYDLEGDVPELPHWV